VSIRGRRLPPLRRPRRAAACGAVALLVAEIDARRTRSSRRHKEGGLLEADVDPKDACMPGSATHATFTAADHAGLAASLHEEFGERAFSRIATRVCSRDVDQDFVLHGPWA
jgi:hypothetical protein